jgi:hypothetical protein
LIDAQVAARCIDVEMSGTSDDEQPPGPNPREDRRWLIGMAISLFFGLFGAVMALLNYSERTKTPVTGVGAAPRATVDRGEKGRRRDRRPE